MKLEFHGKQPWNISPCVHLDKKLTFVKHISNTIQRAEKTIRILYPLLSRNSRLNSESKLLVYKVMFRPLLTYGSSAWINCADTHKKRLQISQNKILKLCLNLHWRTATTLVHDLAKIDLISQYMIRNNDRFILRCSTSLNPEVELLAHESPDG